MATAKLNGLTDVNMKDNMSTIKNMVSEHSTGLMEESITDLGKMASSMVEGSISLRLAKKRLESG